MTRRLTCRLETWRLRQRFTISRGSRTEARVLVVEIVEGTSRGRGEAVPYGRYGETPDSVEAQVRSVARAVEAGADRHRLASLLHPGAARNAVDCALWDLEAKLRGRPVWQLAGLPAPEPLVTAYTLGIDRPERMAEAARAVRDRPLLKIKLAGDGADLERVRAVRTAAPEARLVVDANEAWNLATYEALAPRLGELGVALLEQPFPAAEDGNLAALPHPVPVCADESCHVTADLERLRDRYDFVNIKLDKTGGLTEALALRQAARAAGFGVMVGCMVGTSLAMAPAFLVAQGADVVDLDGPLLLARDREPAIVYEGSRMLPPPANLWG
ncbi:MAG TPA: dipeptide epimerase [Rhodospirillales bacterium]|nr:dipeptide epimerase [Rhodospirillales bacterium]